MNERQFIETVHNFYLHSGRHHLPWRQTAQPYRIVVSEVMLQQTQVERLIPKYQAFVQRFPNTKRLATATLADVLRQWQGLGYNRRAKLLWECAQVVSQHRRGRWPTTYSALQQLPGIGPYTAGAVMAFAYNEAVSLIETNVRTVYLYHFFPEATAVPDEDIRQSNERCLSLLPSLGIDARSWYAALMDYGSYLKQTYGNPNGRSKSYIKPSPFHGSDRQVRGAIIRALTVQPHSRKSLRKLLSFTTDERVDRQLRRLAAEGLITKTNNRYRLPQ